MVRRRQKKEKKFAISRLTFFNVIISLFIFLILFRLFFLQVVEHNFYEALASGQHEIYKELVPIRGQIYAQDKTGELYPIAQNRDVYFLYAVPKELVEPIENIINKLAEQFTWDDETKLYFSDKLSQENDPYEPIKKGLTLADKTEIESWQIKGLYFTPHPSRYYPNDNIGSHILGFYSFKSDQPEGQYGLEGYFEQELAGTRGVIQSERDAAGRLITVAPQTVSLAENGMDLVLTIDNVIQHTTCKMLDEYVSRLGAQGGSVIVMEPDTGKLLAMCGSPDFDPNQYYQEEDIIAFNNPAIAFEYEPGSIFKPITLAAGLDLGVITPDTTYYDEGCMKVEGWYKPICNSDIAQHPQGHGLQIMTNILELSLNTGAMTVAEKVGSKLLKEYIEAFGFGRLTNISLTGEADGNISTLDQGQVYTYTASFGQGITVTPLQMVAAYGVIANGGKLMKPYVVEEKRYSDGSVERNEPVELQKVISPQVSTLLSGMLVSVIENGHAIRAGVPGYYLAGKTGTAQVPSPSGGYSDETIHSFVGFGPIEDPKFVIMVRLDNPGVNFAASSAAPLFGELAKFILDYYQIAPLHWK